MTKFLFPDNTVLCNFAAVDRLELLKAVLDGQGRWTEAVAYEAGQSAQFLPALRRLITDRWLGEEIEIVNEKDIRQTDRIRRAVFGGTAHQPLKHLGEAQTCFVIAEWAEFAGSWWVSDDREAIRYANSRGITTRETIDLVNTAVVEGLVTARDGFAMMRRMADQGRHLRLPQSPAQLCR